MAFVDNYSFPIYFLPIIIGKIMNGQSISKRRKYEEKEVLMSNIV